MAEMINELSYGYEGVFHALSVFERQNMFVVRKHKMLMMVIYGLVFAGA